MRRRRLATLALLAAAAVPPAAAAPYEWPLREPPALTSTFGEYRSGHFHGGIDLSTGGVVGVPVVAVSDGFVERVRASGAGYGRAIYVRLEDGRTAVYAHLSDYSPAIRAYVEAAQDSVARYEVDLYPPAGRLPVRRGGVIGASGESGAGGPHFHFELRQGDEGLNPLVHGFAAVDTIPPTIVTIELLPLDADARVDGSLGRTAAWPPAARRAAKHAPLPVRGRVGLALRAHDRAPGRPNALAVFSAEVRVDGRPFYTCRLDSASWLRAHEVEVVYDPVRVREGRKDVLRLWRSSGAKARIHTGEGILDFDRLGRGTHRIEVIVSDAAGNRAARSFDLFAGRPPRILGASLERSGATLRVTAQAEDPDGAVSSVTAAWRAPAAAAPRPLGRLLSAGEGLFGAAFETAGEGVIVLEAQDDDGLASVPFALAEAPESTSRCPLDLDLVFRGRHLEARVTSDETLAAPPEIALQGPAGVRRLEAEPAGAGYRAAFTPRADEVSRMRVTATAVTVSGSAASASVAIPVVGVPSGRSGRVEFAGGSFDYEGDSFFGDALVTIEALPAEPPGRGLVMVGEPHRFGSADGVLDGGILLAFTLPSAESAGIGLFRRDGAAWTFAGSVYDPSRGAVTARVRRLADYALLRDDAPPILYNLRPAPESRVTAPARLLARVKDEGSGVTAATLSIVLDGRPVVAEYDPEAGSLTAHLRGPLSPGAHEVRFEAGDRLGNRTAETVRFTMAGTEGPGRR